MTNKISNELLDQMAAAQKADLARTFPIIVQTEAGTTSESLAATGMTIRHVVPAVAVVSGLATSATIAALAALTQVKTIEYDGIVSAL